MKILCATDLYTVNDVSGIYRMAMSLAPAMARRGHAFDLVMPCAADEKYLKENFPGVGFYLYALSGMSALKPFEMFLKSRKVFSARLLH